jgi:hypothetical protein
MRNLFDVLWVPTKRGSMVLFVAFAWWLVSAAVAASRSGERGSAVEDASASIAASLSCIATRLPARAAATTWLLRAMSKPSIDVAGGGGGGGTDMEASFGGKLQDL